MPKPRTHLIEVKVPRGRTVCKVSRAVVVVKSGDWIKFRNRTTGRVYVQVSDDVFRASAAVLSGGRIKFHQGPNYRLFDKPEFMMPPGRDETLRVRKVHCGVYPYAVYCVQRSRFGTGSSMPIIIVPR